MFAKTKQGYLESTSALRLQQHYLDDSIAEVLNGFEFRVSTIEVNIEPELLPLLESAIRKQKNCMVGRDRA